MFTVANTISVGTYTVGFATSVSDLLQDAVPGWNGIVDHGCRIAGCRDNDIRYDKRFQFCRSFRLSSRNAFLTADISGLLELRRCVCFCSSRLRGWTG